MTICSGDFADRVASECREAAFRLLRLQDAISEEIAAQDVSGRMIAELQVLDQVSQTIADLGEVFAKLAVADGEPISLATIALARQKSLRQRLSGQPDLGETDCSDGHALQRSAAVDPVQPIVLLSEISSCPTFRWSAGPRFDSLHCRIPCLYDRLCKLR